MMYKIIGRSGVLKLILFMAAGISAIIFSRDISKGIQQGIYLCADVLVPSLFLFMVISAAAAKSLKLNSKRLDCFSRAVFGISGRALFAVILGITGGYPVAVAGLSELYKNGLISIRDAQKSAYIGFGAGASFLITFIGIRLFNSFELGIVLFLSQIISVLILGVINKHLIKGDYNSISELSSSASKDDILISSVSCAVKNVVKMCVVVILFSGIGEVIKRYFGNNTVILLEVCSACNLLSKDKNILLLAFAAGFGGICVHLQVFQALGDIKINKLLFFIYRIIQGLLTALFTFIQYKLFNISIPVFSSTTDKIAPALSGTVIGAVLLILTGIIFLFDTGRSLCAE